MYLAYHYKQFQRKQSRRIAGARLFLSIRLSRLPRNPQTLDTDITSIDRIQSSKYLGITNDEKFNWLEQAENVCKSLL